MTRLKGVEDALSSTPDLVWEAARLLALGLNPIPIQSETKRPVIRWKMFQHARFVESDVDMLDKRLERWWGRTDHQLGVLTGAVFDLVVLDLDGPDACRLVREHASRGTVAARTHKGFHVWYRHPGGHRPNKAGVAGVKLDVRGDGGYVVVPPSLHPEGGCYSWIISPRQLWPPAPMPEELVELVWPPGHRAARTTASTRGRGSRYAAAALEAELAGVASAPEGTRNDTLNVAAFKIARFIVSGDLPAAAVVEAFLRAAARVGLPETEARRTLASAIAARR
jgi:Bifunctional DNA primase/polymerase, N-terminal